MAKPQIEKARGLELESWEEEDEHQLVRDAIRQLHELAGAEEIGRAHAEERQRQWEEMLEEAEEARRDAIRLAVYEGWK